MFGRTLVDDRSEPPLRAVIGTLLGTAGRADFAVGNVRLGAIDLTDSELERVCACRLLMDRLDVDMLAETADVIGLGGRLSRNLRTLHAFTLSGRLHVRAAGALRWSPDFSVMHELPESAMAPAGGACLVGAHYFSRPVALHGASFTCVLTDPAAISAATARFDQLWADGYDVLPVIRNLLEELLQ
ncbi:MAG: hypothetical protein ABIS27_01140 [Longimicrobiales bacterium]